ncbi:hypothetical protein KL921_002761 [Ogataea angusta]|uniref:RNA polymerase II subunit B1 CTD phosphatase RPAP2 homolog n=1 Tax=Pichia angusta TaxID=870730 RepID=A0AAN6I6T4_PICAN|nr:uncharacterized protein KL928_001527 [Ogataea angusta]KAG7811133.1 hypothetical protein KL921_002761 [Ogataea angusta]KAG7820090.1 hypothetical protein KL928_001527 [Ogataea angusta]KAG7823772.1 hypothetical protein KL909_002509 [Ogataea angusta]KAG7829462.1 hypothetical protein KL920_002321 [Ogataea angusta]KAG7846782.1 hypothetical protein KL941_002575 [Ogataea angusta]
MPSVNTLEPILAPYEGKDLLVPKEANMLTYQLIERLMEHSCDKATLKLLARYLSKQSYEELVTERIINHYCGYPLCDFRDPGRIKEMQINKLVSQLRLPRSYNHKYCCKKHYQCSEFYKQQLGTDALFARTKLDLPRFHPKAPESSIILLDDIFDPEGKANPDDIMLLLREMSISDPHLETDNLIDQFNNIVIREKNIE